MRGFELCDDRHFGVPPSAFCAGRGTREHVELHDTPRPPLSLDTAPTTGVGERFAVFEEACFPRCQLHPRWFVPDWKPPPRNCTRGLQRGNPISASFVTVAVAMGGALDSDSGSTDDAVPMSLSRPPHPEPAR